MFFMVKKISRVSVIGSLRSFSPVPTIPQLHWRRITLRQSYPFLSHMLSTAPN
jgi:hypothetical protein